jgi:hypothetical protein
MSILTILGLMILSTIIVLAASYALINFILPFFGLRMDIRIKFYRAKAL